MWGKWAAVGKYMGCWMLDEGEMWDLTSEWEWGVRVASGRIPLKPFCNVRCEMRDASRECESTKPKMYFSHTHTPG